MCPPQLEAPEIRSAGKKILVELMDTLIPNTTYTVDFSDAISDNNEGNALGNYTYTFSTGEQIDTFEVGGYVVNAEDLEPVKGIEVGLYNDLSDSAFRTKPLMRIARTDSRGHFVIKGVAPGEYRIYALQDADDNYRFSQKSEMIAFSHDTYQPSAGPDVRQDTIWRDSLHIDNIIQVPFTHFYPDDVVLMAFQELQTDRYLLKQPERTEADRFTLYFSYGNPQLPVIEGLNFNADSAFVVETSAKKDTITYWLRDTLLINQDTLSMRMEYLITDSAGRLVPQVDTLDVVAKKPYAKRMKALKEEYENWEKAQAKKKKDGEPFDSIYPKKALEPKYTVPSAMTPVSTIYIEMPAPLARLDTAGIHLYSQIDSLWYRSQFRFEQCDSMLRTYKVTAEWYPGREYSLETDSLAFIDIYGLESQPHKTGIKVKALEEFSTLELQLSGISEQNIVVQLLENSGTPVYTTKADGRLSAMFYYLTPGKYYVRAFVDRNGNGVWDTGNYDDDRQAEDVYYYPSEIECKAKWDVTKQWNLTAQPRYRQKPDALVKQKPEQAKKKLQNRNAQRAKQLGIEYVKKQTVKVDKKENKVKLETEDSKVTLSTEENASSN